MYDLTMYAYDGEIFEAHKGVCHVWLIQWGTGICCLEISKWGSLAYTVVVAV